MQVPEKKTDKEDKDQLIYNKFNASVLTPDDIIAMLSKQVNKIDGTEQNNFGGLAEID